MHCFIAPLMYHLTLLLTAVNEFRMSGNKMMQNEICTDIAPKVLGNFSLFQKCLLIRMGIVLSKVVPVSEFW